MQFAVVERSGPNWVHVESFPTFEAALNFCLRYDPQGTADLKIENTEEPPVVKADKPCK